MKKNIFLSLLTLGMSFFTFNLVSIEENIKAEPKDETTLDWERVKPKEPLAPETEKEMNKKNENKKSEEKKQVEQKGCKACQARKH